MQRRNLTTLGGFATLLMSSLLLSWGSLQSAAAQTVAGANPKAILVELFTSEGCSSCPPADALLREIDGTRTPGGQLIVALSEHVTYWNQLGWADPYSAQSYTDRQNAYAAHFNLDSVYTPQIVVNGSEQFVGSDRASLHRAFQQNQPELVALKILSATAASGELTLHIAAQPDASVKTTDLFAVIADDTDQTSVRRGENSGRTLVHAAVARSLTLVGTLKSTGDQTIELTLPKSFTPAQRHHVVIFAQQPGSGRVLGIDTRPL